MTWTKKISIIKIGSGTIYRPTFNFGSRLIAEWHFMKKKCPPVKCILWWNDLDFRLKQRKIKENLTYGSNNTLIDYMTRQMGRTQPRVFSWWIWGWSRAAEQEFLSSDLFSPPDALLSRKNASSNNYYRFTKPPICNFFYPTRVSTNQPNFWVEACFAFFTRLSNLWNFESRRGCEFPWQFFPLNWILWFYIN